MKSILSAVVGATLAFAAIEAGADGTYGERPVALVIESKTLAEALDQWAQQTGFQIFVRDWELAKRLQAPALKGTFIARDALKQLLDGSPLTYEWVGDKAVSIRERRKVTSPASWQSINGTVNQLPSMPVAKFVGDGSGGYDAAAGVGAAETASGAGLTDDYRVSRVDTVEEIIVTGTHIRGTAPVGSRLVTLGREEIQRSGFGRIQDVLEVLPQNFSGSAGEDVSMDGSAQNTNRGQAVDLRGLGASATLVLVNGHRQPTGGLEGSFVDISSIASSAVERIEILADGASALYGADAVGGVVNFVLRRDFEGQETNVRLGVISGGSQELQASQLIGRHWDGGNILFGYQYSDRDALMNVDTPYGSKNWDFRSLGGDDFRAFAPGGNPGTILDPLTFLPAYAIPRSQDGTSLDPSDLLPGQNDQDSVTGIAALPEQRQHSAFFTFSQDVGDRFEFFADGRFGQRDMTYPFSDPVGFVTVPATNPFYVDAFGDGAPLTVAYSFSQELGGVTTMIGDTQTYSLSTGGVAHVGEQWDVDIDATYGREVNDWEWRNQLDFFSDDSLARLEDADPATALNVFGDGASNNPETINFFRRTEFQRAVSTLKSLGVIANGPILKLPAGVAKLAVGVDYRAEGLDGHRGFVRPATNTVSISGASLGNIDRHVSAVFGEAVLPLLVGDDLEHPRLQASIAARYEDYSDFGSTVNPKIGLDFAPTDAFRLRGTWGTSFRAPRFNELSSKANPSSSGAVFGAPDPRSPTGDSTVLFLSGGSDNLHEETADIWTVGVDITPSLLDGLSISLTYFAFDYDDKILSGGFGTGTLLFEDQWADIITRDPSLEQVQQICEREDFTGPCPDSATVAAIVDTRLLNLASIQIRGIDFDVNYAAASRFGNMQFGVQGTYISEYQQRTTPSTPPLDLLDTVFNPIALKVAGYGSWGFKGWGVNARADYIGGYDDNINNRPIGSWTTVGIGASYQFAEGWLAGTRVLANVNNVFDEEPPFVNIVPFGYDAANASQIGRSVSLAVTKEW